MEWQLGLRWTKREVKTDYSSRFSYTVPRETLYDYGFASFIKMVPTPEVAEKLGDVYIIARRPTVKVDGSVIPVDMTFQPNTPIILKKKDSYESDLSSVEDGVIVTLRNFKEVDFAVDIYPVDNTLEIIKPIEVPLCPMVQDFRLRTKKKARRTFVI